jgi:hypothetical protein
MGSNPDYRHQKPSMCAHATYANIRFEQNLKIKPERIVKIYSINLCSKSAAPLTLFVNKSLLHALPVT